MMSANEHLKLFMEPKSVAIVGVSRQTGEGSLNVLESMIDSGYQGKLYPVNPSTSEILGMKAYSAIGEIPGDIDLAVISTPRHAVPGIIRECGERNIKAVIVVAQGFADAGDEEGKRLQEEIVQVAREIGVRIVGPNTIGTANAFANFHTSFVKMDMERIPVGVVCQSGLFFGVPPALRLIGKGIDLGNACDIDFAEALEYFEDDRQVRVIVLYIEGIRDGKRFLEVASRVARKKPILVLKGGRSERTARSVQSHTGSLAGKAENWSAAFKQCGIIQVSELEELADLVEVFSRLPLVKGRGIGVLTVSGGGGTIISDTCERYNLKIVDLSPDAERRFREMSPPWLKVGNPVDIWPAIMISGRSPGEILGTGLETLLSEQAVDAAIFLAGVWMEQIRPAFSGALLKIASDFRDKPIACWLYEGWGAKGSVEDIKGKLRGADNVMVFPAPERAASALSRLADYSEFRQREMEKVV